MSSFARADPPREEIPETRLFENSSQNDSDPKWWLGSHHHHRAMLPQWALAATPMVSLTLFPTSLCSTASLTRSKGITTVDFWGGTTTYMYVYSWTIAKKSPINYPYTCTISRSVGSISIKRWDQRRHRPRHWYRNYRLQRQNRSLPPKTATWRTISSRVAGPHRRDSIAYRRDAIAFRRVQLPRMTRVWVEEREGDNSSTIELNWIDECGWIRHRLLPTLLIFPSLKLSMNEAICRLLRLSFRLHLDSIIILAKSNKKLHTNNSCSNSLGLIRHLLLPPPLHVAKLINESINQSINSTWFTACTFSKKILQALSKKLHAEYSGQPLATRDYKINKQLHIGYDAVWSN